MQISSGANLSSALQSGLQGFNKASEQVTQASAEIANSASPSSSTNLTESAVQLVEGKNLAQANAKSIETANDTIGSLIDVFA